MLYENTNIQWLGHAGFRIKSSKGLILYIDPFKLKDNEEEGIEKADFIFITHSHYDHCSIEDIQKITKNGTKIICSPDCQSKFRHINEKIELILANPETRMQFQDEEKEKLKFWAFPSYNLSKPFHHKEEDWLGYILDINGTAIYHTGDTDLIPEMSKLKATNLDIALLPIGGNYTMNAGEAAKAASIIKPKLAIPMHFGTIQGTADKSESELFLKYCSIEGINAKVLEVER